MLREQSKFVSQPNAWQIERGPAFGEVPGEEDPQHVDCAVERVKDLIRQGGGDFVMVFGRFEARNLKGRHLQIARQLRGLTQQELATRIGLQRTRVGRIERDPLTAKADHLFRMCGELGITITFAAQPADSVAGTMPG